MIKFTYTLLKSTGDLKPIQNPTGADVGAGVIFGVATDGFRWVLQV
jgi:hypothetical protein